MPSAAQNMTHDPDGLTLTKVPSGELIGRLLWADVERATAAHAETAGGALPASRAADPWRAFAPTSDWDDIVGDIELGNAIFGLIEALYGRPQ